MSNEITIASAGNVFPAALATLRGLGYVVTWTEAARLCSATNGMVTLRASDPLELLGLAKLFEVRGANWHPTDVEIEEAISFDSPHAKPMYAERVDVWEVNGTVHMICVTSFGDPVELSEDAAAELAEKLKGVIDAAK